MGILSGRKESKKKAGENSGVVEEQSARTELGKLRIANEETKARRIPVLCFFQPLGDEEVQQELLSAVLSQTEEGKLIVLEQKIRQLEELLQQLK